jgi:hypothetical protein
MKRDRHVFEGVQNFRNLGTLIDSKKAIIEDITPRISAGNRHYCNLNRIFRSRAENIGVKIQIKTMVKPVAYVSETQPMREKDMKRLDTWKRNVLKGV